MDNTLGFEGADFYEAPLMVELGGFAELTQDGVQGDTWEPNTYDLYP
ncbi:lasso RiPP family leader peptide-containing protein [Kitasatospora sp. cg17-2]